LTKGADLFQDMKPELIDIRHDLHANPELLYAVERTADKVAGILRTTGVDEVITNFGRTGVLGILHGRNGPADRAEKRVLFRADMDALPIAEATNLPYSSKSPGLMHACGHDGHTTVLIGAARHLAETRDFDGSIVFCFQPAEEGGAGAFAMMEDGLFEKYPVKSVFGLHNLPGIALGRGGIVPGSAMASGGGFNITVKGGGGHAALPHEASDTVVAAAFIVTGLQTVVARSINPLEAAVVSITSIHGGDAWNVIPTSVELRCGVRTFSEKTSRDVEAAIRRVCQNAAAAFGTEVVVENSMPQPYPPLVNHPAETEIAVLAMQDAWGVEQTDPNMPPMMGSEDFAFFLQKVPGAFVFLGNGDSAPLHSPHYDFNDDAIEYGVAFWTRLAARLLPPT